MQLSKSAEQCLPFYVMLKQLLSLVYLHIKSGHSAEVYLISFIWCVLSYQRPFQIVNHQIHMTASQTRNKQLSKVGALMQHVAG